jgi:cyanophycinase
MLRPAAFALALLATPPVVAKPGSLLIVGGGLHDQKAEILGRLVAQMPDRHGRIAIVPAASGEANLSAAELAASLEEIGIAADRIETVHIAMIDDPASTDVDESRWAGNASDNLEIAKIARADAIWFTGGDQLRTLKLLVGPDGKDTAMLATIRKRLAEGAVVGGTSAGAAIMGEAMIICGTPDIAATEPVSRNPADCDVPEDRPVPLVLGKGLGFLKGAIFDQHFSQRNRWVRLLRGLACTGEEIQRGFGIDEDTAISVQLSSGEVQVLGAGGVAYLERGKSCQCQPFGFTPAELSYNKGGRIIRSSKGNAQ